MYFIMIYILILIILIILIIALFHIKQKENFDMYTRAGQYSADMFSSRDIPTNFCSKII
jgi:hypothetical protein